MKNKQFKNSLYLTHFTIVLGFLSSFSSCKKEEEIAEAKAPVIGIISITPDTVKQFSDSVFIEIQYEDPNGDIGSADPDGQDIELKDSRLNTPDYYHVKPLAPAGYSIFIKGTLRIKLNTLFLLGNGQFETANFTIKLRDQSGKWSNEVTTDPVIIKAE
jgi:hypothetical protein